MPSIPAIDTFFHGVTQKRFNTMRNASMKVLKNLVCCAAFICLMFALAMPAHAASKADELLQLVNAGVHRLVWLL